MSFSHIDSSGKARMVDITDTKLTERSASAYCKISLNEKAFMAVKNNEISKGDVLTVAKIGAIQAAKRTSEIIPLCHNIPISYLDVTFKLIEDDFAIEIFSIAKTHAATGIEMEAITAVTVAGIIIYDMCKSIDKSIIITNVYLINKTGGKSGEFNHDPIQ
jgi:cyclic pyranopterin phosphate synthase